MRKMLIKGMVNDSMTNCKDATMLIVKHEQNALTTAQTIKMYFHVFIVCKFCRLFYQQSRVINQRLKNARQDEFSDKIAFHLNDNDKAKFQNAINREVEGS